MSLPHATQAQINAMNKLAEEKMKNDGVQLEPVQVDPVAHKHPMLQHHEEPVLEQQVEQESQQEVVEQEEPEKSKQAPRKVEGYQQKNFRMMRERLEQLERERDEAMKYAMSVAQQKPQQQSNEQEEDYLAGLGIDADSLAEGKHLKAVLKEVKDLKKELTTYKARTTEDTTRMKLHSELPDYSKVMTEQNINKLESMNPDLAEMISNTPDIYKRARLAYDMVKRYGIYKEVSPQQHMNKVAAEKNSVKPKPLASISPQQSDSPLSKANAFANMPLSKDIKDQLHREMIAAMKGR